VTELETIVLDWLAKMLGLPACYLSTGPTRGGGVIQGSASEAVLTAMVAARDKYLRETTKIPIRSSELSDEDAEALAIKRSRMVALATTATHSSARKAALILGVRFKAIPVRAEDGYALTKPVLAAALAECRAKGLEPFFLVATLGTTDTCAVDDFAGISAALEEDRDAAVAESESGIAKGEIWVHVDAAYAGAALVCPEVQEATGLAGPLARFHSFDVNMHKWLLVNFDASCLYVRDRDWLVQALSVNQAVYGKKPLVDADGNDVPDYREWQIPLGRRFRSLKIWFVLRSYGVRALQAYIRRTMRLGEEFAGWVKGRPDLFEVLTGPSFALTVFRMAERSQGQSLEERNALTKALYERVNATGKIWLTSTELDGKLAIRLMTAVRTTERAHVEAAFKTLVEVATEVIRE
jgi:aromatic-L-amino-acid decarboxylase